MERSACWLWVVIFTAWIAGCASPNPSSESRQGDAAVEYCDGHAFGWNEDDNLPTKSGKAISGSVAAIVTIPHRLGAALAGSDLPLVSRCGG